MHKAVKNAMLLLTIKTLKVVLPTVDSPFNGPTCRTQPQGFVPAVKFSQFSSVSITQGPEFFQIAQIFFFCQGKKPQDLLICLRRGQVAQFLAACKVGSLRAFHTVAHINPLEFSSIGKQLNHPRLLKIPLARLLHHELHHIKIPFLCKLRKFTSDIMVKLNSCPRISLLEQHSTSAFP
ncbi:hypothetical protein Patl1_34059 [Pistacia atlantica]|uniref:Uncharacterized protein n=1 Tax=Pistacia atlantica TaxID=434234 RepID=A0ACC0ZPR3_9ROSI|nr:hypothetical protein Patl1_34059 [Pistacia atlantica]